MSSDWKILQASQVCGKHKSAMSTGPFGSAISSRFFVDSGVPVIRGGNLSQDIGTRLNHENLVFITEDKAREFERSTVKHGDLIFTCWGTIDQVGLIDERSHYEEYIISNKQMKMTSDPAIADSRFLYYQFSSPKIRSWIIDNGIGSSVPGFNLGMLKSIELNIPPLQEQKEIAHILGTLDDKIELNRKTNETLEAMAKALFKSWFVDFDPVRAKAEGRPTGLPAEISDLFPDSLEDSELGEIPSGWNVQSAGKQYDISIGKTPPRKESQWFSTSKVDMPWLSIRDLGEVGVYADRTSESLTREAVEKFNVKIVPPDTAVLSFKLTIGRVAITGSEMLTNEAIAHFSSLTKCAGSEYTYCLLSQYDYHSLGSTSSIATAVNSQILRDMPLVVPPETIARAFCDTAAPIFSSIKCGQQETHCLSDFRDALLPKLISGEIRIPDAEKMLEEVGV